MIRLTEKEIELIEAVRNFKKSQHNPSANFDKLPSWIYHKIDGINGNGVEKGFTANELEQFIPFVLMNVALDMASKIRQVEA